MAGLGPEDIDLIELHDCFATAEILHYGNLGICKQEDAGRMIDDGEVALGGRIPVNVSGGLLSKGHPLGATGIANIYEVSTHLRNEAGSRQVEGAKIGLTHVIGLGSLRHSRSRARLLGEHKPLKTENARQRSAFLLVRPSASREIYANRHRQRYSQQPQKCAQDR